MTKRTSSSWQIQLLFAALATIAIFGTSVSAFAQDWLKKDAENRQLYAAVLGLDEAAVKDALERGADINWKNGGENMLIMALKQYVDAKVIKFLLDLGADPNVKDDEGRTVLSWARQRDIGRDRNGREIIALLEAATGQATETKPNNTTPDARPQTPNKTTPSETTTATKKPRRDGGAPSSAEVREAIEKKFTNDYIRHFYGIDNKLTFEWTGGITVGALQTVRSAPKPCYPAKLQVSVTAEDPRDGNRSTVVRGLNATTGNYREEIFCFYRDGFGEWAFGVYGK